MSAASCTSRAGRAAGRLGPALLVPALLATALCAAPAWGQVREATQPRGGRIWLEVSPGLLSWSEAFGDPAEDGADGDGSGDRRPLAADFRGPITDRLFPGVAPILTDLNDDADALGFQPLSPTDVSLGSLDFGTVSAQLRRVHLRLEVGILDRLSVEVGAPAVFTEVEAFFAYDSAGATLIPARAVLPTSSPLFGALESARADLQARIDAGSLTPEEEAAAQALLQTSGAFLDALERRVQQDRLLPLASTSAGAQIASRYGSIASGFGDFGLSVPALALPEVVTSADLAGLFRAAPLGAVPPGVAENGWNVPHVEVGARLGLLDGLTGSTSWLRHRTAAGVLLRLPIRGPEAAPLDDPSNYFDLPVGDGQPDLELGLQQALLLGSSLRLDASVRYAYQRPERFDVRIHSPDRPFALALAESEVERDPGDVLELVAVPQLQLNPYLSVGVAYGYREQGADEVRILSSRGDLTDASPLEEETAGTRHRLGVSVTFRTGEERGIRWREHAPGGGTPAAGAEGVEDPEARARDPEDDPRGGAPWRFSFTLQGALAGSGARTPASQLLSFSIRAPIPVF